MSFELEVTADDISVVTINYLSPYVDDDEAEELLDDLSSEALYESVSNAMLIYHPDDEEQLNLQTSALHLELAHHLLREYADKFTLRHGLSHTHIEVILSKARELVKERPTLRIGQAVWTLIPNELTHICRNTHLDFFESKDEKRVIELLYNHFLDEQSSRVSLG